jgi:hypothetical protein
MLLSNTLTYGTTFILNTSHDITVLLDQLFALFLIAERQAIPTLTGRALIGHPFVSIQKLLIIMNAFCRRFNLIQHLIFTILCKYLYTSNSNKFKPTLNALNLVATRTGFAITGSYNMRSLIIWTNGLQITAYVRKAYTSKPN